MKYRWTLLLALWVSITGGICLHGAAPEKASTLVGPLLLRDESLDQVLAMVERWSGKTLLRPQNLPATTVSLNLDREVTREAALRAVETVLQLNGIVLSPLGDDFLKVTPIAQIKAEAPELIAGRALDLPPSGRVVSKLFKLQFLQITELIPQIAPLLNQQSGGAPIIFEKANSALVTDTLSNLQRVETLVEQLDRPIVEQLEPLFVPVRHAKATDVVAKLRAAISGPLQNRLGSATTINPDDRANQIIIVTDPRQREFFTSLIAKLDVRSGQDTRNEVIQLKFAAAKEVASLLAQLVSAQISAQRQNGASPSNAPPAEPSPAIQVPGAGKTGKASENAPQFSQYLTILPEDRSNAIVVSGTEDDFRLIRELIGKIDVLLAQVRIEVVIAEVTLTDNKATGISELGLTIEGDKLTGFTASLPGLSAADGVVTRPTGENSVTGQWDLATQIKLASTPRKTNANILSVPTIITTHNREGRIFVGEQRPMISSYLNEGTGTGGNATGGYRSTISSKDIGIQLSVKPLIGTDGSVQLEVKQEVNDILGEIVIDGNAQPRIGRRATESFISVKDGEIIVLGGLQRNSLSTNSSRLGPVPIIGDLLGARSKEKTRTDLIFFLRPQILTRTEADHEPALQQLSTLPDPPRKAIEQAIGLPAAKR